MYELDLFSEEIMTKCEEISSTKRFLKRKGYTKAKGQMQDSINKITKTDWNLYMEAMEAKTQQDKKENNKHITQKNATLMTLVHAQQHIDELIEHSKKLIE